MIKLEDYITGLIERDGILFSKKSGVVSYPETGNSDYFEVEKNSFWFNHRNNCITEAVLKYCNKNIFFDVGGGNGVVAVELERKGISTVIVEPGIEGCLNSKARNLKNIICSTLENAPFKNNSIPVIGLFDIIEHIDKDVDFLTNVYKLLNTNGLVLITVPAYKLLWSNEDVDAGHFRRYSMNELKNKLKAIGFKIEYSTYIFSVLTVAVFLFRSIPSKLGFNKKSNNLDKIKKEHESKKGIIDKVLNLVWSFEVNKIRQGKMVPFGGSCFVIARKIMTDKE